MEPIQNAYTNRPFPLDLNTLLELYFDPSLTPPLIARRLGISLRDLVDATLHPDFEAAVAALRALYQRRATHLADVAAHSTINAIADGVKAVQHTLCQSSSPPLADASPPTQPDQPDCSSPAAPSPRTTSTSITLCPRRALDSLVRALDRLHKVRSSRSPTQPSAAPEFPGIHPAQAA